MAKGKLSAEFRGQSAELRKLFEQSSKSMP